MEPAPFRSWGRRIRRDTLAQTPVQYPLPAMNPVASAMGEKQTLIFCSQNEDSRVYRPPFTARGLSSAYSLGPKA